MNYINPKHSIQSKFKALLAKYPNIDIQAMGFPTTWQNEPLWKWETFFLTGFLKEVKSLFKILAEHIIKQEPGLAIFNGKLFEGKHQFRNWHPPTRHIREAAKAFGYARLGGNVEQSMCTKSCSSLVDKSPIHFSPLATVKSARCFLSCSIWLIFSSKVPLDMKRCTSTFFCCPMRKALSVACASMVGSR